MVRYSFTQKRKLYCNTVLNKKTIFEDKPPVASRMSSILETNGTYRAKFFIAPKYTTKCQVLFKKNLVLYIGSHCPHIELAILQIILYRSDRCII